MYQNMLLFIDIPPIGIVIGLVLFVLFGIFIAVTRMYHAIPTDEAWVISGWFTGDKGYRVVHGGGAFILPRFNTVQKMKTSPFDVLVQLKGVEAKGMVPVDLDIQFKLAIGTEQQQLETAARTIVQYTSNQLNALGVDILEGETRPLVANMTVVDLIQKREDFEDQVKQKVVSKLDGFGLVIKNSNIQKIEDQNGYIKALGEGEVQKALQEKNIEVAKQEKDGAIGVALAKKEQSIAVAQAEKDEAIGTAEAEKDQQIGTAEAERTRDIAVQKAQAERTEGVNAAKLSIEQSNAQTDAETIKAKEEANAAKATSKYEAEETSLAAKQKAEEARGKMLLAEKQATTIVNAKIAAEQDVINAEAAAKVEVAKGQAEADIVEAKGKAEAAKITAIQLAIADGIAKRVEAAGGPEFAIKMAYVEMLPELVRIQMDALSNLKIDSHTVIDMGGSDSNGGLNRAFGNIMALIPQAQAHLGANGFDLTALLKNLGVPKNQVPALTEKIEEVTTTTSTTDTADASKIAEDTSNDVVEE